jgi:hypothetical protein
MLKREKEKKEGFFESHSTKRSKLFKRLTQKGLEFVFKQSKVAHSFTNFKSSKPIVLNY